MPLGSEDRSEANTEYILVVDDSSLIRHKLRNCLEPAGYVVFEASNGREGLQVAQTQNFGLFIVDVNMPRMNGLDMLEQIRKLEQYRDTPALVLTNESSSALVERGRKFRATAWVVKPFDESAMLKGVDHVFKTVATKAS